MSKQIPLDFAIKKVEHKAASKNLNCNNLRDSSHGTLRSQALKSGGINIKYAESLCSDDLCFLVILLQG